MTIILFNFLFYFFISIKNLTSLNSAPTRDNLMLRTQERQFRNRAGSGNVLSKNRSQIKRIDDQLKTTNKELSLYSYKGVGSSSIKLPQDREAFYQNETKTKQYRSHIQSGSKLGENNAGVEAYNFDSKTRIGFGNYMGYKDV